MAALMHVYVRCARTFSCLDKVYRSSFMAKNRKKYFKKTNACLYYSLDCQNRPNAKVSFTERTHTCGELNEFDVSKEVLLCGWVEYFRLSLFVILRDGHGSTQLIFTPEMKSKFNSLMDNLTLESVLKVKGKVKKRPEDQYNLKLKTGKIEIAVNDIEILNPCRSKVPFNVRKFQKVNEDVRLTHRYMDLRTEVMQKNLRMRSKITMLIREYLCYLQEFVDVETPTLFSQTPGGAREFIVPTKKYGKYYSLTQSPQQFKQLLMAGGIDRYFQIARCYRDESTKPDRQPEFTQVDIEMSYVTKNNIQDLIEGLFQHLFAGLKLKIQTPFTRITYKEAMEKYNTDKPDLRKDKNSDELAFLWVENFPMFLPADDGVSLESAHHPFTAPHLEDQHMLKENPEKVRSQHYDLVLNGQEIGGGSIRIHDSKLQKYILEDILKENSSKLSHLLEALELGCPPHGGIALGLDRVVAILCGTDNIRNVIAFPKSLDGKDLMSGAPTKLSKKSLTYYHQIKS